MWTCLALVLLVVVFSELTCCLAVGVNIAFKQMSSLCSLTRMSQLGLILRTCIICLPGTGYALLTSMLHPRKGLHGPKHTDPGQPLIVCVHGLYHNRYAWSLYGRWFKKSGLTNVYTWSYSSLGSDFRSLVRAFSQDLKKLIEDHPGQQLVLIGHSLGGLVIKAGLADPGLHQQAALAVTLASPHQGSLLASMAWGRLGRSLGYRGPLVRSLWPLEDAAAPLKVSLFPPLDTMVLPAQGLRTQGPGWQEEVLPPMGHVSPLIHHGTYQRILDHIQRAVYPSRNTSS